MQTRKSVNRPIRAYRMEVSENHSDGAASLRNQETEAKTNVGFAHPLSNRTLHLTTHRANLSKEWDAKR